MRDEDKDITGSGQSPETLYGAVTVPGAPDQVTLKSTDVNTLARSRSEKARGAAESLLAAHTVIKERFLLEELVGFGGMGTVYKARDLRKVEAQDREPWVAIKLLNEDFQKHPQAQKALHGEVKKSQTLAHPNIVQVFDFDRDGEVVFMTMELLEGQDLNQYIQQHSLGIPLDEVLRITREMGSALQYAHENQIIHADFTPKNVFITNEGKTRVLDFGVAQAIARVDLAVSDGDATVYDPATLGGLTPGYAGTERLRGMAPVVADDVFALGCIVYELLSGAHPYKGRSAVDAETWRIRPQRLGGLSAKQWRALRKAMALSRVDRYQSVQAFLDDFSPATTSVTKLTAGVAAMATLAILVLGYNVIANYFQGQQRGAELQAQEQELSDRQSKLEAGQVLTAQQTDREQQHIIAGYLELVETLLAKHQHDEAQNYLDRVRQSAPNHPALDELQNRIDESRAEYARNQAALARRESNIARLSDEADAHIAAGRLLRPEGASAFSSYEQIQALAPDSLPARALLQRLVQLHLDGLDKALHSGDLPAAETWLNDMARIAPGNRNLSRLRAELNQALAQKKERGRRVAELLAQADSLAGDDAAARRRALFLQALDIDPVNRAALAGLDLADAAIARADELRRKQLTRKNAESLLQLAQQLLGKRPATPENFHQAREFILQSQQHSADLQEAEVLLARLPQLYADAIQAMIAEKDYPEAKSFLDAALALAPQSAALMELRNELDALAKEDVIVVPASF